MVFENVQSMTDVKTFATLVWRIFNQLLDVVIVVTFEEADTRTSLSGEPMIRFPIFSLEVDHGDVQASLPASTRVWRL